MIHGFQLHFTYLNCGKNTTQMSFILFERYEMFTFFFIISLLWFYLNILFCVFFCSSLWREYNCNEWHHLLSWISWWIPKLSRLFLACKSTPWEWNLHQFYCSSNRTNLWFHYCMVSQDHCYWLIQLYVAVKQGRNENISQSSVQIAIRCLNWCNWVTVCVLQNETNKRNRF